MLLCCCVFIFFIFFFITPERYCSALRCNPRYLVCSHRLQRWKVEPGVDLLLREGLALKSGVGQTHREDILKFLFPSLTCATPALLPPTRKQLASVIRRRTFFIHFISSILFVCLFLPPPVVTKVLCPPVMPLLITIASHRGIRIWRESRKGAPCLSRMELDSRWGDN